MLIEHIGLRVPDLDAARAYDDELMPDGAPSRARHGRMTLAGGGTPG